MGADGSESSGRYSRLSRTELIRLLEKRDRERKFGLVWERNDIEADRAVEGEFVAATPDPVLHELAAPWGNLVIEGDNYDALRWLRMTFSGRVKCIYVDPPYNTGNKDWVYNDRYFEKEDIWRHSTWLEFLYRRFSLARDLLAEDGVVFVSINDENRAKLELMLDEVFPGMRIGSFVWRTKDTANDADHNFSSVHEHVLVYGKGKFSFPGIEIDPKKYRNPDRDRRGQYSTDPITQPKTRAERPNGYYPIRDAKTGWWYPCNPDSVWRYVEKAEIGVPQRTREPSIEELQKDNRLVFTAKTSVTFDTLDDLRRALETGKGPKDGNGQPLLRLDLPDIEAWVGRPIGLGRPYRKAFWEEKETTKKPVGSWILSGSDEWNPDFVFLSSSKQGVATREVANIFGNKAFSFPKPAKLLHDLLAASVPKEGIVLDFFAGSATTAQAVMSLNAEDGGNRKFIMVSSTEATTDEPDKNLCRDVTAERIRRLNASNDAAHEKLSAAFAYLRCRKLAFEDVDYDLAPEEVWATLEALHQLPLTTYESKPWNVHETEDVAIVYVDRFSHDLIPWVKDRAARRKPVFVYAWAPGQMSEHLAVSDVEIRGVRETLISRFRQ